MEQNPQNTNAPTTPTTAPIPPPQPATSDPVPSSPVALDATNPKATKNRFALLSAIALIIIGVSLACIYTLQVANPTITNTSASTLIGSLLLIGAGILALALPHKTISRVFLFTLAGIFTINTMLVPLGLLAQLTDPSLAVLSLLVRPERILLYLTAEIFALSLTVLLYIMGATLKHLVAQPHTKAIFSTILLGVVMASGSVVLFSDIQNSLKGGSIQQSVESSKLTDHLAETYNEDFAVQKTEVETRWRHSFDNWTELTATVYPVKKPDITFEVKGCIERCNNDNIISDAYAPALWQYQLREPIAKLVYAIYGQDADFEVIVGGGFSHSGIYPIPPIDTLKGAQGEPTVTVVVNSQGAYTKDTVAQAVTSLKELAPTVKDLGYTKFYVRQTTETSEPPEDYRYPRGVTKADVTCTQSVGISYNKFDELMAAPTLADSFSMVCSYKTAESTGGGIVRATYPE